MIIYPSAVVDNAFSGGSGQSPAVDQKFSQSTVVKLRVICQSVVQIVDIGLVMLVVVEIQSLLIQHRHQGIRLVG